MERTINESISQRDILLRNFNNDIEQIKKARAYVTTDLAKRELDDILEQLEYNKLKKCKRW